MRNKERNMADEIKFTETNSMKIYDDILDNVMDYVSEPLYPGDERRIYTEAIIQVLVSLYNTLNDVAKQRMLQYARGEVLDAIGDMEDTPRLQPDPAHDTIRFYTSETLGQNILIPAGTRVTAEGEIYFATDKNVVLQAGTNYVDTEAYCQTPGSDYNNISAGTLNVLVDVIPYISSVSNLYGTTGGDDGEPYDEAGDDHYRERIRLSKASYSVAGPVEAYKYFALSASPDISDILVDSPEGNVIDIYVLMNGGALPTDEILEEVENIVGASDVRPMTDKVTALAPTQISYDIEIKYYTTLDNEAEAIQVVEADGGAIDQYNEWQTSALGRDINPDYLRRFILAPENGSTAIERIDVVSPVFKNLTNKQVAKYSGSVKISHEIIR